MDDSVASLSVFCLPAWKKQPTELNRFCLWLNCWVSTLGLLATGIDMPIMTHGPVPTGSQFTAAAGLLFYSSLVLSFLCWLLLVIGHMQLLRIRAGMVQLSGYAPQFLKNDVRKYRSISSQVIIQPLTLTPVTWRLVLESVIRCEILYTLLQVSVSWKFKVFLSITTVNVLMRMIFT